MIQQAAKGTPEAAAMMRIVEEELSKQVARTVRVSEVIEAVIAETGIDESKLFGMGRHAEIVRARRICTVCIRDVCKRSFPEIARDMKKKHHSAFIHQYRAERDDETQTLIAAVKRRIGR